MKEKIAAHSEKEYIFSGEETLSYGLKGKKHKKEKQEAKKEAQERSTEQHTTQNKNVNNHEKHYVQTFQESSKVKTTEQ